jgi:hypothetical protein
MTIHTNLLLPAEEIRVGSAACSGSFCRRVQRHDPVNSGAVETISRSAASFELAAHIGKITGVERPESSNLHSRVCQNVPDYAIYRAQRSLTLLEAVLDHVLTIRLVWQHNQAIRQSESFPVLL